MRRWRVHPAGPLVAFAVLLPASGLAAGGESDVGDIAWRVGNLALLLGVIYVFGRERIKGFFRDRRDRIQGEIASAAELRREVEERHARWERQLADLDAELDRIRSAARERAEAERDRVLAEARAAAERIRDDARVAVEQELRRARAQLREEACDLSVQLAGELLRGEVTDADRERLMDEFIERIEESSPDGSGS